MMERDSDSYGSNQGSRSGTNSESESEGAPYRTLYIFPCKLVYAVATFKPSTSKYSWLSAYCSSDDTLQKITACLHGRFPLIHEENDEASHKELHSGNTYQFASRFLMMYPGPKKNHKHYNLGVDDDHKNFEAALVLLATLIT